jgi:ABC-type sugar transport system substrate-binding protein
MRIKFRGTRSRPSVKLVAGGAATALALTLATSALASPGASGAQARSNNNPPYTVKFHWGTFHLASKTANKLKQHKQLVFDMSYQDLSQPGGPTELQSGLTAGAKWAKATYGINIKTNLIGTETTNPPGQISQIQDLVKAGQVDCVGVEPVTPGAFNNVINSSMSAGVPMFTVNTDSPASHRIAYSGVDDTAPASRYWTGVIAGKYTVAWAHKNHVNLKTAAMITGDNTAPWAQGRMAGWEKVVKQAFPHINIIDTPTNAFTTGYDPATILTDMEPYVTGHPSVQFYYDSDWGAAEIAEIIKQRHLEGKVFTLGYNVDATYLQDIENGSLVATIDQRYDLQAENYVKACAKFLARGILPPSHYLFLFPSIWSQSNVKTMISLYSRIAPGLL